MIGFRVDANESVATGHLMRCMAIAAACRKQGEEVVFFLAEEKECDRLRKKGFPFVVLHSQWNALEEELPDLKKALQDYGVTVLVVDTYQATSDYLLELNRQAKVVYMDDMGEEIYQVAALVHYCSWKEESDFQKRYKDTNVKCLVGMQYTPLRAEFYPAFVQPKEKSVLVTTGGTDPFNIAGKLVKLFMDRDGSKMKFRIICGSMNAHRQELYELEERYDNVSVHENVSNMGELMRKSTMAVSAGGTTLFELCACKVPTVCFSFADNQERFTREMGEHEVMRYAGDARQNPDIVEQIYEQLMELWKNEELCGQYRETMGKLVDGKGVERIAEEITSL